MALDAVLALPLHRLLRLEDLFPEVGHHEGHYLVAPSLLVLQLASRFFDHPEQLVAGLVPPTFELAAEDGHRVHFDGLVLLLDGFDEVLPDGADLLTLLSHFFRHFPLQVRRPRLGSFLRPLDLLLGAPRFLLQLFYLGQHFLVQLPLLLEPVAELLLQLEETLLERQQSGHLPSLLRLPLRR